MNTDWIELDQVELHERYNYPYGLDHPSWSEPGNFMYETPEKAWAAIDRTYGPNTEHVVVALVAIPRPGGT